MRRLVSKIKFAIARYIEPKYPLRYNYNTDQCRQSSQPDRRGVLDELDAVSCARVRASHSRLALTLAHTMSELFYNTHYIFNRAQATTAAATVAAAATLPPFYFLASLGNFPLDRTAARQTLARTQTPCPYSLGTARSNRLVAGVACVYTLSGCRPLTSNIGRFSWPHTNEHISESERRL